MVLEKNKKFIRKKTRYITVFLGKFFSPNQLTFLSLVFSMFCSIFYSLDYLVIGVVFAALTGFFDVFDGMVARDKSVSSRFGDFLDHTIDRVADAIVLMGVSFSSYVDLRIGFLAVVGVLMTGYVGTQAEAVSGERIYRGLTSRADIFFLIALGSILTFLFSNKFYSSYLLNWFVLVLAVFSNITAIQRALIVWKKLS